MSITRKQWKRLALAGAVVAALGFGGATAASGAIGGANDAACPYSPPNRLGFCSTNAACDAACEEILGPNGAGICVGACCTCGGGPGKK